MSTPSLTLFDLRNGEIIIAPNHRFRTIITIGNGHIFGAVRDRDRGNALVFERDAPNLLPLLAHLVAQGIGEGIFRAPCAFGRVGVRHRESCGYFGCYGLNAQGEPNTPIVAVKYTEHVAIVQSVQGHLIKQTGVTPEDAMLQAARMFITNALAA